MGSVAYFPTTGSNPKYCKYNCDYKCSMCAEAERNDARSGNHTGFINPLADGMDDDVPDPMHGVMLNEDGELTGFPLQRFNMMGQPINTGTSVHTPYVPAPLVVLKENQIVEIDEEVFLDSPDELVKGAIIT